MTLIHMGSFQSDLKGSKAKLSTDIFTTVMFRFRPEVTQEHKDTFVRELKKLKELDCVKRNRLVVGGPSVTDPIERSKGFEIALLSFHEDLQALETYQASKEHHW